MSHKCMFCGEIVLTANHVCKQATQKMIDQMNKATETVEFWPKSKRDTMSLKSELAKLKRQWAEDDRDITALEDENNRLHSELAAERKKREAAEYLIDYYKTYRDRNRHLSSQVDVLREGLQTIIDDHCGISSCSCCDADVETAEEILANLPAESAKIRKVLEAAGKWIDGETGSAELSEAVLKLRE